jgi:hypothetical protein
MRSSEVDDIRKDGCWELAVVGFLGALQEFEVWSCDFLDVLAAGRQTSYAADMIGGEPLGKLGNAS